MRLTALLKMAGKNIIRERARLLLSFLCLVMTLLTLGTARLFFAARSWGLKECDLILAEGIDNAGTIVLQDAADAGYGRFLEAAIDSGKVRAIGSFQNGVGTTLLPELMEKQHSFPGMDPHDPYLRVCSATRWALGLCRELVLREKMEVPEEKWEDPNWCGVYLGASFTDVPLGTTWRHEAPNGMVYEWEVIGLLDREQRVLSDRVIQDCHEAGYDSSILLDQQVLFLTGSKRAYQSSAVAYVPAEGVSLEEAQGYLEELAREHGVNASFQKMRDGFRETRLEDEMIGKVLGKLAFVLVGGCFLINVGTVILQFEAKRSEYGILYAIGYSRREICGLFVAENGIKMAAAFLPALGLLYGVAKALFSANAWNAWVMGVVYRRDVIPCMAVASILFTAAFASVPAMMLARACPADQMN